MNLFGRKKKNNTIQPHTAILTLEETLSTMEKREIYLEKQIADFTKNAKVAMKNNQKPRALHFLKRKKILDKQLESCFNMKLNVEMQIAALKQASHNTSVINAISIGSSALKSTVSDPDKVADTVDSLEEQLSMVDEISDVLSRPVGEVYDEDELLLELRSTTFGEQKLQELEDITLPTAPVGIITTSSKEEEDRELRELEALMMS